jgi:hypothetical protein
VSHECIGKPSARGRPCSCHGCVTTAHMLTSDAMTSAYYPGVTARESIALVLRAIVSAALVDVMLPEEAHVHAFVNAEDYTGNSFCECGEQE